VFVRYVAIVYGMYVTMHYDHVGTMYTSENKMLFFSVLLRNSLLPVKYSLSIFQMHSEKKVKAIIQAKHCLKPLTTID